MSPRLKSMVVLTLILAGAAAVKHRASLSTMRGFELSLAALQPGDADQDPTPEAGRGRAGSKDQEPFTPVRQHGSVDIDAEYDLSGLLIPKDQIHTLLPRDAIPALTDPKTEPSSDADWLPDEARVISVVVDDQVLGVPLRVLDWHEIVNTTLGGEPIAVTYCPLCDSATVFSRRVTPKAADGAPGTGSGHRPAPIVLEFGVSGALFNSNVLMYDRANKGLWSQLGMRAVSGPYAGISLDMLPVEVVTFAAFKKAHPGAPIVSRQTGHQRDYTRSPYESYFKNKSLMVPVAAHGDTLPRKTLGVGIAAGEGPNARAWFVPVDAIPQNGHELTIAEGKILLTRSPAGVAVVSAPKGVRTAQSFYYSWSAFYPDTTVVSPGARADASPSPLPGLRVGAVAPDVTVTSVDGSSVRLSEIYKDGPVVLTFYRGGWCPICTRTLAAWGPRMAELKAAGAAFIAITPEKPDLAAKTRDTAHADYTVFSDGGFAAAKAFNVHFVVDQETKAKYEQFGLKVAESNVSGTWELPAPATFVIDRQGVIRWQFADWDYSKRADPDLVIEAVRALK